ncbi:MAG TPA: hypothetical protein PKG63_05730 [Bacteroidales bacterium]|jgi:hypothetical protein|nr:hypothetical protein [Bacteroidales bacterium]
MKKLFLLILAGGIIFTACKKEEKMNSFINDSCKEKNEIIKKDWYPKLGIEYSINNFMDPDIKSLIIPEIGEFNFELANTVYYLNDYSIVNIFISCNNPNDLLIYKVDKTNNLISEFIISFEKNMAYLKKLNGEILYVFELSNNKGPDCNQLGPIHNGETVSQCIVRNFSNFPCDAIGTAAIVLAPREIFAACAVVCGVSAIMS